jgi:hypothetical protein
VTAELLVTVPLGFGLGFVIGLTGVGGGALVAPALYVVLGLSYQDSVALSLIFSIFTKIVGAIQHIRQGTVVWTVTLLFGVSGIPGAVLGSRGIYGAGEAAERVLPFVMGAVLLVVALLILIETLVGDRAAWQKPFSPTDLPPLSVSAAIVAYQLVVGLLMGTTSIGSGSLVVLAMLYLFRMTAQEVVGSNLVIALIMVVPAGLTHYVAGGVSWATLALLLLGSLIGSALGARATLWLPERAIKLTIVVLVLVAALSTALKAIGYRA